MAAAPPLGNPRAPPPPPFPLYIVREREGSRTLPLAQPSPSSYTSSSSIVLGEALLENHELHHHHAVVLLLDSLPQPLPPTCYIKVRETSPGCTCVERGGVVRSALDRIFRDLNHREYDSINRVLIMLPLSDLQGYEDALPLSLVARISID